MYGFRNDALRALRLAALCLLFAALLPGLVSAAPPHATSGKHRGRLPGFLAPHDLPDALTLLPPPPGQDSAAFAADEEAYRAAKALRGTPRWTLAAFDADRGAEVFSCAVGVPITEKETPNLYRLMYRAKTDEGLTNRKVKEHYRRTRPFVVYKEPSCSPEWDAFMAKNGSYPSGHSTFGWAWALILSEIAPDRANAILARGYSLGQSRIICGVHWQSDVTAGRTMGAALVARLHADPAFRVAIEAARAEVASARARNLKPALDCRAEAAALALHPAPAR